MTQITGTACKIMTHKKEKHSRAKARVETTVVVGEAPRGTSPAYPIAGYVVTKTCWSIQVREDLSGWPTPGVASNPPASAPMSPGMGHFLPFVGEKVNEQLC